MNGLTLAQTILLRLGVHHTLLMAHRKGKLPSFTKKGPGRKSAHLRKEDE